jgi:hypothetical protein
MSHIAPNEGTASEKQLDDFVREYHTITQLVIRAETMDPAYKAFDPEQPWRGQAAAVAPNLFEELKRTFPQEVFCLVRGQRRMPYHGPPLEPVHTWVNRIAPNLPNSHIIDIADTPYRLGTPAKLRHTGISYEGLHTLDTSEAYLAHAAMTDVTVGDRTALVRDLFEIALLQPPDQEDILQLPAA